MKADKKPLYTLIALEDFKALFGLDDRDDKIIQFCLVTATHTIEQYCKRRLLRKTHFEYIDFYGDLVLPLKEYPVVNVSALYALSSLMPPEYIETGLYQVTPDCGTDTDLPFNLHFSPAIKRYGYLSTVKAVYTAGYRIGKAPADLATANMELASWNLGRYKGRRVGMTGNVKGSGREGEHFEMSMPENVRLLLEPYRRKTI